ncbi:MAG: hypothetical protein U0228_04345 [Myxococcaceae bacterium]
MELEQIEVREATVTDFDGKKTEVKGGVWLSPEAFLSSEARLQAMKEKQEERERSTIPWVVGAALLGAVVGYWLARSDE